MNFTVKVEKSPCAFVKSLSSLQKTTELVHVIDVEGNDSCSRKTFNGILENLSKAKKLKSGIRYSLGYCNLSFELWFILHKTECFGTFSFKDNYLPYINRVYETCFSSMRDYKREDNFTKVLNRLVLEDVYGAVKRAHKIQAIKIKDGIRPLQVHGYEYFGDAPSLSLYQYIEQILQECGLVKILRILLMKNYRISVMRKTGFTTSFSGRADTIVKWLPNTLSIFRIGLSLPLIIVERTEAGFIPVCTMWSDGFIARKLQCVTTLGARLDSIADVIFSFVLLYLVYSHL